MPRRVLVVDDEQGFRDLFTFILEPLGFEVVCVVNGEEAVRKIEEREYDLILMDVHMPILPGPEAVKRIHKIRSQQKVIILSSGSDPTRVFENESEKYGTVACLFKPVEFQDLTLALEKALGPLPQQI